ncbi:MAG TPA: RluA family pseudouridine synthase [Candidatus Polarisedimenticolia bacterium]|jgi:23S rRNA pseudouridine1911/1915/1917 synthase
MPLKDVSLEVGPEEAGRTLAAVLHTLAGLSHATAKGLVARGLVRVNGRPVRDPTRRLAGGERLEARFDAAARYHPPRRTGKDPTGFRMVLEDDDFVVVDKDPGLLTVPAPARAGDTLADRILEMYAGRGVQVPGIWVVHRIDRFTSGLVLFARTEQAALSLSAQFEKRTARREYLAICEGVPRPGEARLRSWLVENPRSLKVAETRDRARGLEAICAYRMEEELSGAALLRVTLETGRRNQIRVQLAGINHPLIGDRTYGKPSPLIPRVALHAARLGFAHPRGGGAVRVESPLPADMRRLLRRLRRATPPAAPLRGGLTRP